MNQVAERLTSFRVYQDGNDLLGVADVELPDIEYLTETVKGAGIAGEVDSPSIGQVGSMQVTLNWRTITKPMVALGQPKVHSLDLRGASQTLDSANGVYKIVPVKIVIRGLPKNVSLGKFDVGAQTDSSTVFEVIYLKVVISDQTVLEIDKYNNICVIDGVDYLAEVRAALGIV